MEHQIVLTLQGRSIGKLGFTPDETVPDVGNLTTFEVRNPDLANALRAEFQNTRRRVVISGGTSPLDVDRFYDGIVMALRVLQQDFPTLEFSAPEVLLERPGDVVPGGPVRFRFGEAKPPVLASQPVSPELRSAEAEFAAMLQELAQLSPEDQAALALEVESARRALENAKR